MFLFEAQTGRMSPCVLGHEVAAVDWHSSYYHYVLADEDRAWAEEAVEAAARTTHAPWTGGLEYPREFLVELGKRDLREFKQPGS